MPTGAFVDFDISVDDRNSPLLSPIFHVVVKLDHAGRNGYKILLACKLLEFEDSDPQISLKFSVKPLWSGEYTLDVNTDLSKGTSIFAQAWVPTIAREPQKGPSQMPLQVSTFLKLHF